MHDSKILCIFDSNPNVCGFGRIQNENCMSVYGFCAFFYMVIGNTKNTCIRVSEVIYYQYICNRKRG